MEKNLTFRHVVKTLIPGFITSIAIMAIIDLVAFKILGNPNDWMILRKAVKNPTFFAVIIIPLSMFFGIIVNTFCFVYLFHRIREFNKRYTKYRDLLTFKGEMTSRMKKHYAKLFDCCENELFDSNFDIKSFLLNRQEMENLQYIRTGYFYYLEFQINTIITLLIALVSFITNLWCRYYNAQLLSITALIVITIASIILVTLISGLLWFAILKNDFDYERKELSYLLGAFHICKSKKSD